MIIAIIIGICSICFAVLINRIGNAVQEQEQHREKFAMLVAQELHRLDLAIKHNNKMIAQAEAMLEPEPKWWGRN
jgi:hypothetical protein